MDLAAAIAAITNSDIANRAEILSAINTAISSVESLATERDRLVQNNAELLKEKKKTKEESARLQTQLNELIADLSIDGTDLDAQLAKLKETAIATTALQKERDEAIAKLAQAEEKAQALENSAKKQAIAARLGADLTAFTKLVNLPTDLLVIENETVYVTDESGNKTNFRDWSKGEGEWLDRALFGVPATEPEPVQKPKLPEAPPSGKAKQPISKNVLKRFTGPRSPGHP